MYWILRSISLTQYCVKDNNWIKYIISDACLFYRLLCKRWRLVPDKLILSSDGLKPVIRSFNCYPTLSFQNEEIELRRNRIYVESCVFLKFNKVFYSICCHQQQKSIVSSFSFALVIWGFWLILIFFVLN